MIDREKIIRMANAAVQRFVPSQKFIDELMNVKQSELVDLHPGLLSDFAKMSDIQKEVYLLKMTAEIMLMAYEASYESFLNATGSPNDTESTN